MSMVIPDAIEPVVGWRCFDIVDGLLVSPQQRMPWPPGKKAQASCANERWHYEWVQSTPEEREALEAQAEAQGAVAAEGHYIRFLMPDGEVEKVPVYMPWGMKGAIPPVTQYPEEGKAWVLVVKVKGHASPNPGCNCGIHIAKDFSLAFQYRGQTSNAAIGLVKGWGKVIPASRGYRVEFAYPHHLFLFDRPEGPLDLTPYGITVAPILECEEFLDSIGVKWR